MTLKLTDQQLEILAHKLPGHARILAGPGTGKSTTAVALVDKLLGNGDGLRVKFLTFTRAATSELTKKLAEHGANGNPITDRPATIHSFSISVVLSNPGASSFPSPLRIPDKYESDALIAPHLAPRCGVGVRRFKELLAEMSAKWESLAEQPNPTISSEERARFMGAWLQHRKVIGYTLLAEIPDLLRQALLHHDDLKAVNYDLLIVDEYQDLNACDLEVLKLIAKRGCSIIGIGDDDQSIYSFRKAHPDGIRKFLNAYSAAKNYHLTICQRCPKSIIEWAQFVIQGDVGRERRPALECRATDVAKECVALLHFRGDASEAKGIADLIGWLHTSRNIHYSEILILSRTDRAGVFTQRVREELLKREIPMADAGEVQKLVDSEDSRFLLAILHLLTDPSDSLAWWTLLSLTPGLGTKCVDYLFETALAEGTTFGQALLACAQKDFCDAPNASQKKLKALVDNIAKISQKNPTVQKDPAMGWGKWVVDRIASGNLPQCPDGLKALFLDLDPHVEPTAGLDRYLAQVVPLGKDIRTAQAQGVRIMTMMSSKGLTVRATIIMGVENEIIPDLRQNVAEERRLLYVAMTRSQEHLYLTWATSRRGPTARSGRANVGGYRQPSEFLRGGPIESQDGIEFLKGLPNPI